MRKQLPENKVSLSYKEAINELIEKIMINQKDNIVSVFITGSYARGDAKNGSDIDIWIIMHQSIFNYLDDIGKHVNETSRKYGIQINPQCLSLSEIYMSTFDSWTEKNVKILDAVLLYGEDLFDSDVSKDTLMKIYKNYLVDILIGIRHYITVNKPKEKLTHQRIENFILKPLLFPLRMERYCEIGLYPITKIDLLNSYTGSIKEVVEYSLYKDKFEKDIEADHKLVLRKIHDEVDKLIKK